MNGRSASHQRVDTHRGPWGCLKAAGKHVCFFLGCLFGGWVMSSAAAQPAGVPATRIVTLSPHATELVFAAGAGPALVGAVDGSDFPAGAAAVPRIGALEGLGRERILALQPDLVVAWPGGNPRGLTAWLRRRGIDVLDSDPHTLEAIAADLRAIGERAGTAEVAESAARRFEATVGALRSTYAGRSPVRVFHPIWPDPLMTVGRGTIVETVIALCGGVLVPAAPDRPAWVVSREAVLAADPQLILDGQSPGAPADRSWRRYPWLSAVRAGQWHSISPDLLHRPGPRLALGATEVCERIEAARHAMVPPHGS